MKRGWISMFVGICLALLSVQTFAVNDSPGWDSPVAVVDLSGIDVSVDVVAGPDRLDDRISHSDDGITLSLIGAVAGGRYIHSGKGYDHEPSNANEIVLLSGGAAAEIVGS